MALRILSSTTFLCGIIYFDHSAAELRDTGTITLFDALFPNEYLGKQQEHKRSTEENRLWRRRHAFDDGTLS